MFERKTFEMMQPIKSKNVGGVLACGKCAY